MNAISDTVMTLAVTALFAEGATRIRNVAHIRHKESDRIAALAAELRKLGARVDEHPDGLVIAPPAPELLHGAAIATYDDHRMAMSFALAGLRDPRGDDPRPRLRRQDLPRLLVGSRAAAIGSQCVDRRWRLGCDRGRQTHAERRRWHSHAERGNECKCLLRCHGLILGCTQSASIRGAGSCGCSEPQFKAVTRLQWCGPLCPLPTARFLIAWRAGTPAPLPAQLLGIECTGSPFNRPAWPARWVRPSEPV